MVSQLLSSEENNGKSSECEWYFVNFTLDTFGIVIFSFFIGKLFNCILRKRGAEEIHMGNYNIKPDSDGKYRITKEVKKKWLRQVLAWITIVTLVLYFSLISCRVSCVSLEFWCFKKRHSYTAQYSFFSLFRTNLALCC